MQSSSILARRHFLKLGAMATGSALITSRARAEEMAAQGYELPELPYAFDALEPHIDGLTMEIHHGKHHAGYVKNLNAALAAAPDPAAMPLEDLLTALPSIADESLRTTLRNNGGGHWNHSFFWESLTPEANSGTPSKPLLQAIDAAFGSRSEFEAAFSDRAAKQFGSGWAWLIQTDGKLKVVSTPNQDNPLMKGTVPDENLGVPLLAVDVWEHAYYLHYQNRRADYLSAFWKIVNWDAVSARFEA